MSSACRKPNVWLIICIWHKPSAEARRLTIFCLLYLMLWHKVVYRERKQILYEAKRNFLFSLHTTTFFCYFFCCCNIAILASYSKERNICQNPGNAKLYQLNSVCLQSTQIYIIFTARKIRQNIYEISVPDFRSMLTFSKRNRLSPFMSSCES